jgi:hypothetical protein
VVLCGALLRRIWGGLRILLCFILSVVLGLLYLVASLPYVPPIVIYDQAWSIEVTKGSGFCNFWRDFGLPLQAREAPSREQMVTVPNP